jgi:hypothetical protein
VETQQENERMELSLTNDQVNEAVAAGKLVFEEMGVTGDIKSMWDPTVAFEVEEASRQFDRLVKEKKYRAYRVTGADGAQGEPMATFDASAGRIIFVPPMQGG